MSMLKLRRYFITGLLIILPAFITFYVLYVIFRLIDGIWGKVINYYLIERLGFSIPGLGFILGVATILLVGFFASKFFGRRLFLSVEAWFLRFPIIKQLYPAAKQVVDFIFSKDKLKFNKVAMVEFPRKGLWSLGFITNEGFSEARKRLSADVLNVFIPSTPNPITGWLVFIPKSEVVFLDMSVEDAIKLVVSGGILNPNEQLEQPR